VAYGPLTAAAEIGRVSWVLFVLLTVRWAAVLGELAAPDALLEEGGLVPNADGAATPSSTDPDVRTLSVAVTKPLEEVAVGGRVGDVAEGRGLYRGPPLFRVVTPLIVCRIDPAVGGREWTSFVFIVAVPGLDEEEDTGLRTGIPCCPGKKLPSPGWILSPNMFRLTDAKRCDAEL
jgi:hypothetical protein